VHCLDPLHWRWSFRVDETDTVECVLARLSGA
jgi:hypothetical protein